MSNFHNKITKAIQSYGQLFDQNRVGPKTGTFELYISQLFDKPFREVAPKSYDKLIERLIDNRFEYIDEYTLLDDSVSLEEALNRKDFSSWLRSNSTKFSNFDLSLYVDPDTGLMFSYGAENVADLLLVRGILEMNDAINPTVINNIEMPTEFILFDTTIGEIEQYFDAEEMLNIVQLVGKNVKVNPLRFD